MTRTIKWMATALFVSVAVNVFVVGFMAGRGLDRAPAYLAGRPLAAPQPDFTMRALASQLPASARDDLGQALRQRRQQLQPAYSALREERNRLRGLLTAEDYDGAAVSEVMAEIRRLEAEIKRPVHETVAETLARLSPEQRRAFVEALGQEHMVVSGRIHDIRRSADRP